MADVTPVPGSPPSMVPSQLGVDIGFRDGTADEDLPYMKDEADAPGAHYPHRPEVAGACDSPDENQERVHDDIGDHVGAEVAPILHVPTGAFPLGHDGWAGPHARVRSHILCVHGPNVVPMVRRR